MIESLLDTYAPIQKMAKAEVKTEIWKLKLKLKPWLIKEIMSSIKKKNIIYKKIIKVKNLAEKKSFI